MPIVSNSIFFIQSLPSGKPNLVTPSLAKLNVDALRHDIPRYQHNMPKEAADAWERWLHQLDGPTLRFQTVTFGQ